MQGKRHRGRLALVPCPFQGHITPMLQLGSVLHSKGFPITIVHIKFNSPDPSNHPDFNFQSIPDGLSDHFISSGDALADILVLNNTFQVTMKECFDQMIETQGPVDKFSRIIYDEFMYMTQAVADQLKIPSISLRTSNAASFLARAFTRQLFADGCIPLRDSLLQEPVPNHFPLRFKDLPISKTTTLENVQNLFADLGKAIPSSAIIWNTMDCLEQPLLSRLEQKCPVPIFAIGPMHKIAPSLSSSLHEEETSCIEWLDKQTHNSVIYVSMGSLASMNQKEFAEMAWGLAASKQPFLWVVRPGLVHGSVGTELLPAGFEDDVGDRGCIVKWAPQKEVLAHAAVGGFWSHCGWNSTLESICEGVPMICRPNFADQMVNARYVSEEWRVGLLMENSVLDRGEIECVIRRLMADEEGEKMRQRAMQLKERAEFCTKAGGSSYNSLEALVESIPLRD